MAGASSSGGSPVGIQSESSTRKLAADILVEPFRVVFHQDSRRENLIGVLYGVPSTRILRAKILVGNSEEKTPLRILIRKS